MSMSDIVEKLRFRADENYEMLGNIHEPLLEAAAEIERLREWNAEIALNAREFAAENERLRAALEVFACDCTEDSLCRVPHACRNYVARAALEGRT